MKGNKPSKRGWEIENKSGFYRHKNRKKKIEMGHYLNWAQALATAWGFMLLVGLMCCCLSTQHREHGDASNGNSSCTCDGGYAGVWLLALLGCFFFFWISLMIEIFFFRFLISFGLWGWWRMFFPVYRILYIKWDFFGECFCLWEHTSLVFLFFLENLL